MQFPSNTPPDGDEGHVENTPLVNACANASVGCSALVAIGGAGTVVFVPLAVCMVKYVVQVWRIIDPLG